MNTDNSHLVFPLPFSLKIMGEDRDDFQALVVDLLTRHVLDLDEQGIVLRPSRDGRYVSITVRFTAQTRAQLDAIYQELSAHERVLMVL